MRRRTAMAAWASGWLVGLIATGSVALGDEPAQKFLNKLRENEYYDIAIEYLNSMENSSLVSDDFKKRIKFEKAECLLMAAGATRDIVQIEQHLNQADQHLKEFADSKPDPLLLAESERVRARTLFGRGNLASIQSKAERWTAAERGELQQQARELFNQALAVFEKSLAEQREVVKNVKVDPTDPTSVERREKLWAEYVETRFMAPAIREQIADTLDPADSERPKLLAAAAAEFADIAADYPQFTRGSYARIAAARCYSKLDQPKEALRFLVEILVANVPRSFKLDAAILAIEAWEKSDPPGYAEICARIGEQTELLAPRDVRDPKIAAVQLGYAKACRAYAEELSHRPNGDEFSKQINDLRRDAARYSANVARGSNPLRETARQLIAEWNLSESTSEQPSTAPTNFAEAKSRAIDLLDSAGQSRSEVQRLAAAVTESGADKATIESQLQEQRAALVETTQLALEALKVAMQFVDAETSREEINGIRMRQAVANFYIENFYEAAVLGEHLLNRYPNIPGSREAAGIAMRSYLQLSLSSAKDNRDFERKHLESICQRIITLWPDEPGTDEAANVLITLALQNSDLQLARNLLNTMEQGSASRARLETHMGRMMWNQYLIQSQKTDSNPDENQALLNEAEQLLASGVASLQPESLTVDGAFGALNLIQLRLARGEVEEAIAQLETGRVAPLDVIKQKLPPAEDPKFVRETYRTALQAYVTGMRQGQQADALLNKAHNIVVALRESTSEADEQQRDTLIAIYYQLAKELLAQLDRMEQPDEKAAFAQSLGTFIQSLREQTNDAKTLMWIGTTLNSVGDKLVQDNLTKIAKELRGQAVESLNAAEKAGFAGLENADALMLELKRQQAIGYRGLGQFDEALAIFADVLRNRPTLVSVQVDAAKTLQMQADQTDDPNTFAEAVAGTRPEKRPDAARASNLIWGWRQIALATKGKESFSHVYFEAVYNMSYCRLRYGEILNREDAKKSALSEIQGQFEVFPELGGEQWKPKFIELARRIQKSLGQPESGLH